VHGGACHSNGAVATCCPLAPRSKLFCWMVVFTQGYEADLARESHSRWRGIFACDAWSVLSDGNLDPIPITNIGSMRSPMAPWGSYYNAEVFVKAWEYVTADGRYLENAWTVKADPDTVWVPQRLRDHLQGADPSVRLVVRNGGGQVYLGPLEVFSVAAVWDFINRHRDVCYTVATYGEDGWIAACMFSLGATFQTEEMLLKSDKRAEVCRNSGFIAHHPFKDVVGLRMCYDLMA